MAGAVSARRAREDLAAGGGVLGPPHAVPIPPVAAPGRIALPPGLRSAGGPRGGWPHPPLGAHTVGPPAEGQAAIAVGCGPARTAAQAAMTWAWLEAIAASWRPVNRLITTTKEVAATRRSPVAARRPPAACAGRGDDVKDAEADRPARARGVRRTTATTPTATGLTLPFPRVVGVAGAGGLIPSRARGTAGTAG